jgi:F-type H+-transporting ATPase subunit b
MLIDWFTVGAQSLNFVILVWLMKRFLYQPILNAIDAREKSIADELTRADTISQQAKQEKISYESKNLDFDHQREQLIAEATEAANSERQRLLEVARKTAEALETKQQKALQNKMQALHDTIRQAVQKQLFAMAKNALRDLAAVDIESQIVAVFTQQLRDINNDQKSALQAALKATQLTVLSSNVLSPDQQSSIATALDELLDKKEPGKNNQLLFEQSTDLIGGIELQANGFKIGWSIAEYLHTLESSLAEQIDKHISTPNKNCSDNQQTPVVPGVDTA